MNKVRSRRYIAAAVALLALFPAVAMADARTVCTEIDGPDYLVLDPERE